MPRQFKAVIFDLDGVLVDTAECHFQAWKQLTDELKIPFDREKNERLKGVPRLQSLKIILEGTKRPATRLSELADRKNGYYVERIRRITPKDLLPGVGPFLKKLRKFGVRIGVASSSKNAKAVLSSLGIEKLLDVVVDGDGHRRPKPHPEIFLTCAKQMNVRPKECVVVEDAQVGVDAGRKAGMYVVGVGSPAMLRRAHRLVKRASDLPICPAPSGESVCLG